jgi:hypothetical protein
VSSPNAQENFAGLMPLVRQYVASINVDLETRVVIDKYLDLVSKRASGTLSRPRLSANDSLCHLCTNYQFLIHSYELIVLLVIILVISYY